MYVRYIQESSSGALKVLARQHPSTFFKGCSFLNRILSYMQNPKTPLPELLEHTQGLLGMNFDETLRGMKATQFPS